MQLNLFCNELKEKGYIARSLNHSRFIERMSQLLQKKIDIEFDERFITLYTYDKDVSEEQMLLSYKKDSFYSMSSALNVMELSDFRSDFIFISKELSKKNIASKPVKLEQQAIDEAFAKPYRRTHFIGTYNNKHIIMLTPKNTDAYGVETNDKVIRYSSVERALVEMIVNVQYFKNAEHIIKTFKPIKKKLDIDDVYRVLERFDFIYPYFQSVGFYLEKIGFTKGQLHKFKERVKDLKFYTEKQKDRYEYDEYWQIYF
jgi:hypothetical protein